MSSEPTAVKEWLSTPLGRRCLANEQRLMRGALERVFGEQMLQIGAWGAAQLVPALRAHAAPRARRLAAGRRRRPRSAIPSSSPSPAIPSTPCCCRTRSSARSSPHAVLREVDRILRADGHLIVLSFASGGLWGLRHSDLERRLPARPRPRDARRPVARLARAPVLRRAGGDALLPHAADRAVQAARDLAARGMGAALAADVQRRLHAARAKTRASADARAPVAAAAAAARGRRPRRADDARVRARAAASGAERPPRS